MRTLVDLPDQDVQRLDELARRSNRSRAAVIREAVAAHLRDAAGENWLDDAFGLWAHEGFSEDGVDYQRRLRAEWDRN